MTLDKPGALMKIHGDMISPYVRVCFVTAHEAGIGNHVKLVPTAVSIAAVNEQLATLSPIAQIPVLVIDDGTAFHDSRVIVDYLCHAGGRKLLADGGAERFRTLTLQAIAHGIADAAVSYRNEVAQRPQSLHWHPWLDRLRLRVNTALDALDSRWQKEMSDLNVGSIACAVVLSYLDYRFAVWSWRTGRPQLAALHDRFNARPSMQATALPA